MDIISQVVSGMQTVLTTVSDTVAQTAGFIKRRRKLTGSSFVQTLVFGWLANPKSTYEELAQAATTVGVTLTPQAIEQRFTPEAADSLKQVLDAAVEQIIATNQQAIPLLERFNGVFIQDSSWIALPDELAEVWKGCGNKPNDETASSVKIQLRWELLSGSINHLALTNGTTNDKQIARTAVALPSGSLRLADLGYFSLDELKHCCDGGIFWLTRIPMTCEVFDAESNYLNLQAWLAQQVQREIELPIRLGVKAQLPCRLLAQRVATEVANKRRRQIRRTAKNKGKTPSKKRLALAGWNILVTNISPNQLTVKQAMILVRVRWQIELLFKLWKSHGQLNAWRSEKPWRILCEVYAKLIAMIIQHWILLTHSWHYPERSLTKAARVIARYAFCIAGAVAVGQSQRLAEVLITIGQSLAVGCRIYKRRACPSTYQLLMKTTDESLLDA